MRSCSFGIVSFLSAFVFSSFFVRVSLSFPVSPSRSLFHLSLCPFRFSTTAVCCEIVTRLSSSTLSINTRRVTLLGPLVLRFRVEKDCGAPQPVFSSSLVFEHPLPSRPSPCDFSSPLVAPSALVGAVRPCTSPPCQNPMAVTATPRPPTIVASIALVAHDLAATVTAVVVALVYTPPLFFCLLHASIRWAALLLHLVCSASSALPCARLCDLPLSRPTR